MLLIVGLAERINFTSSRRSSSPSNGGRVKIIFCDSDAGMVKSVDTRDLKIEHQDAKAPA